MVNYPHDLNLIFHALADPTRRSMLEQVYSGEKRISDLVPAFDMSLAAISKHVTVLEKAGLIFRRKQGRDSYISLNQEALMDANEWTSTYTQMWTEQLDSLEKHLVKNKKTKGKPK